MAAILLEPVQRRSETPRKWRDCLRSRRWICPGRGR